MKTLKDNLHIVVLLVTGIAVYALVKASQNASILKDNGLEAKNSKNSTNKE